MHATDFYGSYFNGFGTESERVQNAFGTDSDGFGWNGTDMERIRNGYGFGTDSERIRNGFVT
jgi:hypothetical protein